MARPPLPADRRRDVYVGLRLTGAEEAPVRALAAAEHGGDMSAAIRALLVEALDERTAPRPALRPGDHVDVIDGVRRRPAEIKHHWNATGELVVVLSTEPAPDVLCANDDGAGRCGHPEHLHGALGCMSEDPVCWCDEYVSPKSINR